MKLPLPLRGFSSRSVGTESSRARLPLLARSAGLRQKFFRRSPCSEAHWMDNQGRTTFSLGLPVMFHPQALYSRIWTVTPAASSCFRSSTASAQDFFNLSSSAAVSVHIRVFMVSPPKVAGKQCKCPTFALDGCPHAREPKHSFGLRAFQALVNFGSLYRYSFGLMVAASERLNTTINPMISLFDTFQFGPFTISVAASEKKSWSG